MSDANSTAHWPTEIKLISEEKTLVVSFDDGQTFRLPAELLRVESPSAGVQGHSPGQKKLVTSRRHVNIMKIEQVGNYAVRIDFDDLHDTGIYTWEYLYGLGLNQDRIWADYLAAVEAAGLSREP